MTKNDYKKKFPDVKVQRFELKQVLSKQQIMDIVNEAMTSLNMGLIYYESRGRNITCLTSAKMKAALDKKNYIIKCFLNERTGKTSRTLSHAKKSSKSPYVYRVWLKDGKILDKELLYAYGESLRTIKSADEEIYNRLIKNNDNG